MTLELAELTATIVKADIAMKASIWEIERLREDLAMLRKAILELAYVAEENGIHLANLTRSTQDVIVAIHLGGFK